MKLFLEQVLPGKVGTLVLRRRKVQFFPSSSYSTSLEKSLYNVNIMFEKAATGSTFYVPVVEKLTKGSDLTSSFNIFTIDYN